MARGAAFVFVIAHSAACLDDAQGALDAPPPDVAWDVVSVDAGPEDGPGPDAPGADAPTPDAGNSDALQVDGASITPDADVADAVAADVSAVDGASPDAAMVDASPADAAGSPDAASPYRHSIVIDGVNDFIAASEQIGTTSTGYLAFVSWDDNYLYVGYEGPDVASGDGNKWILVFLDTDPAAALGATLGETYNTQQPGFPTGFMADYYFRWKADNSLQDVRSYDGSAWVTHPASLMTYQAGTFVETRVPRADLGSPTSLSVAMLMLNATPFFEWSYAGLYPGSFSDGYYSAAIAPIPLTRYMDADFASSDAPSSIARMRP